MHFHRFLNMQALYSSERKPEKATDQQIVSQPLSDGCTFVQNKLSSRTYVYTINKCIFLFAMSVHMAQISLKTCLVERQTHDRQESLTNPWEKSHRRRNKFSTDGLKCTQRSGNEMLDKNNIFGRIISGLYYH